MKKFKAVKQQEVIKLICDGCGLEARVDEGYEFSEFITIEHTCGYGTIHGDGKQLSIDLCQHCFAGMCGDILTLTDPLNEQESDVRNSIRDILLVNKISNLEELQIALKRVEQLWDAQYHSTEGNELHTLADLICAYESKSWDSYFAQGPFPGDDFMDERFELHFNAPCKERRAVSGMLNDISANKDINEDDSCQSSIDDENTD